MAQIICAMCFAQINSRFVFHFQINVNLHLKLV